MNRLRLTRLAACGHGAALTSEKLVLTVPAFGRGVVKKNDRQKLARFSRPYLIEIVFCRSDRKELQPQCQSRFNFQSFPRLQVFSTEVGDFPRGIDPNRPFGRTQSRRFIEVGPFITCCSESVFPFLWLCSPSFGPPRGEPIRSRRACARIGARVAFRSAKGKGTLLASRFCAFSRAAVPFAERKATMVNRLPICALALSRWKLNKL